MYSMENPPHSQLSQHSNLRGNNLFLRMVIRKSTMPSTPLLWKLHSKKNLQTWWWNFSSCIFLEFRYFGQNCIQFN